MFFFNFSEFVQFFLFFINSRLADLPWNGAFVRSQGIKCAGTAKSCRRCSSWADPHVVWQFSYLRLVVKHLAEWGLCPILPVFWNGFGKPLLVSKRIYLCQEFCVVQFKLIYFNSSFFANFLNYRGRLKTNGDWKNSLLSNNCKLFSGQIHWMTLKHYSTKWTHPMKLATDSDRFRTTKELRWFECLNIFWEKKHLSKRFKNTSKLSKSIRPQNKIDAHFKRNEKIEQNYFEPSVNNFEF